MGCAQGKPSPAWGGRVADVAAGQRAPREAFHGIVPKSADAYDKIEKARTVFWVHHRRR
jgi:hypothetical protein